MARTCIPIRWEIDCIATWSIPNSNPNSKPYPNPNPNPNPKPNSNPNRNPYPNPNPKHQQNWLPDISEILMKVALNTINPSIYFVVSSCFITINCINLHTLVSKIISTSDDVCLILTVTRRVSYVGHELLSSSKHMSSTPVFSGVLVARSCLCSVFVFCPFTFGHCHSSSVYPFGIFKLFVSRGHEQVNT